MSQTVTNRSSQLNDLSSKVEQTVDSLPTYSTKDSNTSKSRLGVTDTENQCTLVTEDAEEWTSDDIKDAERRLNRESVHTQDYQKDFDKLQQELRKIMDSKLPINLKTRMMESLMEKLKTTMNCVKEVNVFIKEQMAKGEDYSKQQAQQKETSSPSKRSVPVDSSTVEKQEWEDSLEEVRKDIKRLEETIAQMKQTRNSLTIALEDKADSIEDIQALLKEKKQALDRKTILVENLKHKSEKKASSKPGGGTHRKTNSEMGLFGLKNYLKRSVKNDGDKTVDISTSRLETSVLKEMSSKIGNVFGKMGRVFGKKEGKVSDQILNTEFLRELENQSTPVSLNNSLAQSTRGDMNLSISNFNFK